jgi:hypothetical protein
MASGCGLAAAVAATVAVAVAIAVAVAVAAAVARNVFAQNNKFAPEWDSNHGHNCAIVFYAVWNGCVFFGRWLDMANYRARLPQLRMMRQWPVPGLQFLRGARTGCRAGARPPPPQQ